MRTRFFRNPTNHIFSGVNYIVPRSHHDTQPTLPKIEIAELIFLGIFGVAALGYKLNDDKKNRLIAQEVEKKADERAESGSCEVKPVKR